ncbi:hypothetical protein [Absidia glauca]|uniref:Uncharacterized protein n=1 Tax=Absidia glauca TaxID=4829 RepID=A0A168L2I2_ABSGL|nr:hypothetical protein [Absidia glauca]
MESFLTTLPPYVHQYINKYPPTECFNVLKDLICFAVLYSNDREHVNLLSLELMQKGADRIIVHHPYTSAHLASKQVLRASPIPMDSVAHQLSPTTTIAPGIKSSHSPPPPSLTTNNSNRNNNKKQQHTTIHLNHGCQPVLKEDTAKANATDHTNTTTVSPRTTNTTTVSPKTTNTTATATKPEDKPLDTTRKSTMPSVFPDWWAHPDTETNQVNDVKVTTLPRSESPVPSDRPPMTKAQEMNITNWIPSK